MEGPDYRFGLRYAREESVIGQKAGNPMQIDNIAGGYLTKQRRCVFAPVIAE